MSADDGVEGKIVPLSGSEPSILGWQMDLTFSSSDADTVAWTSGTITLTEGTTYSISAGNTGNMTALTYIYLSKSTSLTVLQKTTTASSAVGLGKILVAVAENNAGSDATFQVFGGKGGSLFKAANIAANCITANEIVANTITTSELSATAINGMTITGSTIQTAATGYRTRMTSANGVEFMNGGTQKGIIYTDASYSLILKSYDDVHFFSGANWMGAFTGNSLDLPSNNRIAFASGTNLIDNGSYWRLDRGGEFNGNVEPDSDNDWKCGGSSRRWSEGWYEDITVDDLVVNTGCTGCGYAELNYLTDKQKEAFMENRKIARDAGRWKKSKKKNEIAKVKATSFEEGDVLAWKGGKLIRCKTDTCCYVRGVANNKGIPIIFGAEVIKVIGKVKENQFLVGSTTLGFARAWSTENEGEPPVGAVIGQAMEDKLDEKESKIMAGIFKR